MHQSCVCYSNYVVNVKHTCKPCKDERECVCCWETGPDCVYRPRFTLWCVVPSPCLRSLWRRAEAAYDGLALLLITETFFNLFFSLSLHVHSYKIEVNQTEPSQSWQCASQLQRWGVAAFLRSRVSVTMQLKPETRWAQGCRCPVASSTKHVSKLSQTRVNMLLVSFCRADWSEMFSLIKIKHHVITDVQTTQ